MQILSAKQMGDAYEIETVEHGAVLISEAADLAHLADWVAQGGVVVPYTPPAPVPVLSREAFCVALIGVGILTEAEAEAAALGAWPPKFEPALTGKSLVEKLTIKNLWQGTKTVARDAPLFLDLLGFYATLKGLLDRQAAELGDMIFKGADLDASGQ